MANRKWEPGCGSAAPHRSPMFLGSARGQGGCPRHSGVGRVCWEAQFPSSSRHLRSCRLASVPCSVPRALQPWVFKDHVQSVAGAGACKGSSPQRGCRTHAPSSTVPPASLPLEAHPVDPTQSPPTGSSDLDQWCREEGWPCAFVGPFACLVVSPDVVPGVSMAGTSTVGLTCEPCTVCWWPRVVGRELRGAESA